MHDDEGAGPGGARPRGRLHPSSLLRDLLVFLFLLLLGLLAGRLPLGIVPGSSLHFSGFPALILAARMGPLPAALSILLLNLPGAGDLERLCLLSVVLLEALVVSLARRGDGRRNVLGIDCLYWPLLGAPLLALLSALLLQPSPRILFIIVTNAWFNGLVNASLAGLVADSPLVDALLGRAPLFRRSMAEYLKVGASVAVLPISILGLSIGMASYRDLSERQLAERIFARLETAKLEGTALRLGRDGFGRLERAGPSPAGSSILPWRDGLFRLADAEGPASLGGWMRVSYFGETAAPGGRLRYIVAAPEAFAGLLEVYSHQLILRLAYFYVSYLVALLMSRALVRRFDRLQRSARGLPGRIERGEEPDWPEEDFEEFHLMSANFRAMSARLTALFRDLLSSRDGLERLVAERTKELDRLNAELRGLLARIEGEREEERARVARELHDEFGQNLASLGMALYLLERRLPREDERGRELLSESRHLIETLSKSMKRLVSRLRPGILDRLGLPAAIESLAGSYSRDQGREIEFEQILPDDFDPSGELTTALYRIAQESLLNAIKHSESERISIRIASDGRATILQVRDWGRGFNLAAQAQNPGSSFGIIGMRERCLALGGELEIVSREGEGTLVSATFKTGEDDVDPHSGRR